MSASRQDPFGWHLIQVLERRTADMSSERRRLEARKALLDRKGDEAYRNGCASCAIAPTGNAARRTVNVRLEKGAVSRAPLRRARIPSRP